MKYILDTSAVLAFFLAEKGGLTVKRILQNPSDGCCMHSVNWVELYYKMHEKHGGEKARIAVGLLSEMGVAVTDVGGRDFLVLVAETKIDHPSLSLGDCYAIALSKWLNGTVVTSDKCFSDAAELTTIKQIR